MLAHASHRAMSSLTSHIFSRVQDLRSNNKHHGASPIVMTPISALVVSDSGDDLPSMEEESLLEQGTQNGETAVEGSTKAADASLKEGRDHQSAEKESTHDEAQETNEVNSELEKSHHDIVSLLPTIKLEAAGNKSYVSSNYGIEALGEVLKFIFSMISAKPQKNHSELSIHGIDLISGAIQAAGPFLGEHGQLVSLLRNELVISLFKAAENGSFTCIAAICQLSLTLYALFKEELMPQIEAILSLLLLPLAEGSKPKSIAHRQVAMEGLLDFCRQPGFLSMLYLNLDSRIQRENLYEKICGVFSKAGFPSTDGSISSFHSLSLEGMKTILEDICEIRTSGSSDMFPGKEVTEVSMNASEYFDIWSPLCEGQNFVLPGIKVDDLSQALKAEKNLKEELCSAAEHFNRNQKKGFEYCQTLKLLPTPLTAKSVARFLKSCPGLSKSAIGEVLGERDEFYEDIRTEFISTFDFRDLRFDIALRLFMEAFRPPGEGQKIDRIMQSFGKRYFEQSPYSGLKSADAAYVLAFSVIMLNTDLHNSQNKRKMTLEDFARINRNTNEGEPMPNDLLSEIYAAISTDEFKISAECSTDDLTHQAVFWMELAKLAEKPRGRPLSHDIQNTALSELRRDMFKMAWGPTLASVSVILDGSAHPKTIKTAVETLSLAAALSSKYEIEGVIDQILASLIKYTIALDSDTKPAEAYGGSYKSRSAVESIFTIADSFGDSIRSGWKYVLSCIMKLYLASLLTPAVILADGGALLICDNTRFKTWL